MQGWLTIGTKVDKSGLTDGIEEMEDEVEESSEKISLPLKEIEKKLATSLGKGLKKGLNLTGKLGKAFMSMIGFVVKLNLSLIGITAVILLIVAGVSLIAKAFKKVFENNEQLKADFQYIGFAIRKAIEKILELISKGVEPASNKVAGVIQKILGFIIKVVQYTAFLINAWTGINLFEGATMEAYAEHMKEASESAEDTAKSAKEIKKQLAGFDEMNILSDNSSGGATETGGGFSMPSFDLSALQDMEVPEWLLTIRDIGQWIIDNWETVVTTLLLVKLFIDVLTGNWLGVVIDAVGLLIMAFFKVKDAIKVIAENWKEAFGIIGEFMKNKVITPMANLFANLWQKIKDGFKSAVAFIKEVFSPVLEFFRGIIDKVKEIFVKVGEKVGEAIGGGFKGVINGIIGLAEGILNAPIKQINNLLDKINDVPGINIKKLNTLKLPRLAKGGIVNMPGKGVPVGGALTGERRPEGVIPLTDSQQMALLGEAIGKYITINASIINTMNGRVISKELQRINAENDFAFNR